MASAHSFLSEDQLLCSICLDVFTEPVSIPCGHNFCKACLTRHWADKQQCQCPLCNEKFNKGLKLCINTGFRDVVENFKKQHVIASNNSPVKPGQVPCDCCPGNKFRASKTCLVCLASFCETHLEHHQSVAALKKHKLTNPVQNLEDKICKKHNRILEFFCRNDCTRVCILCTEHSTHDTVPLEEEYVDKRAQMGKKKEEVQEIWHRRKKKGKAAARANSVKSNQINYNCQALHNMPVLKRTPETVQVFVDYTSGLVSFYDAGNAVWVYSFPGRNFNERICLFVGPRRCEAVGWLQRLRTDSTQLLKDILCFIAMMALILCSVFQSFS